jgi:threonine synthase
VLGTLAGYSFLSRISKYFCEKCGLFDRTITNYNELEEELDRERDNSSQNNEKRFELSHKT